MVQEDPVAAATCDGLCEDGKLAGGKDRRPEIVIAITRQGQAIDSSPPMAATAR